MKCSILFLSLLLATVTLRAGNNSTLQIDDATGKFRGPSALFGNGTNIGISNSTYFGNANLTGAFSGNGAGLTNINGVAFQNVLSNGVVADGVTDTTTAITNLLNRGGSWWFPPGNYLSKEVALTNNTSIHFTGAHLIYATGAARTNIFWWQGLNTNIFMTGSADFDGQAPASGAATTFTTYAGTINMTALEGGMGQWNYWLPTGLRHGVQINTDGGGVFGDGIKIHGFSGAGLIPISLSGQLAYQTPKTAIHGVTIYSNLCGFFNSAIHEQNWPNSSTNWMQLWFVPAAQNAEYATYDEMTMYGNAVGMDFSCGNSSIVNSTLTANYFQAVAVYGDNPCHGLVGDCLINHSGFISIYMLGQPYGELIRHCQFRGSSAPVYGNILDNCAGVEFEHCQFDPFSITNVNTGANSVNFFRDNTYVGTWASQGFSTDGKLLYGGNHSYTVAGDSDGQAFTLVESTGNGSGLTNLAITGTAVATNSSPYGLVINSSGGATGITTNGFTNLGNGNSFLMNMSGTGAVVFSNNNGTTQNYYTTNNGTHQADFYINTNQFVWGWDVFSNAYEFLSQSATVFEMFQNGNASFYKSVTNGNNGASGSVYATGSSVALMGTTTNNGGNLTNINATNIVSHNLIVQHYSTTASNTQYLNTFTNNATVYLTLTNTVGASIDAANTITISNSSGTILQTLYSQFRSPVTGVISIGTNTLVPFILAPNWGFIVTNNDAGNSALITNTVIVEQ